MIVLTAVVEKVVHRSANVAIGALGNRVSRIRKAKGVIATLPEGILQPFHRFDSL
jgi:hypothetical protein